MNISAFSLRDLEYIAAVADLGHFGRAAEACGVSQPALSAQIQKVEQLLDIRIFERTKRRVVLTTDGAEIVEQARLVLQEAEKLVRIAKTRRPSLSGAFRLGAIATLGPYLLPHLLKPLKNRYPDLELVLAEGLTESLLEQLRSGRLDAVLASLPVKGGAFHVEALFVEPFYLAVPAGHQLAAEPHLHPRKLVAEEILLLEDGHCLRNQALEVCRTRAGRRQPFHATSLETLRHMVALGSGYTLMPALAVYEPGNLKGLIKYRPFHGNAPGRTIGLVWRRSAGSAGDARAFAAFVRENLPSGVKPSDA